MADKLMTEDDVERMLSGMPVKLGPHHPDRVQLEILRRLIRIDEQMRRGDDVLAKAELLTGVPPAGALVPAETVVEEGGALSVVPETEAATADRFKGKGRKRR